MPDFTVFYSHPRLMREGGSYTVERASAEIAGEEALDMLPGDLCEDEEPVGDPDSEEGRAHETELSLICDDLEVAVYAGALRERPAGEPAFSV